MRRFFGGHGHRFNSKTQTVGFDPYAKAISKVFDYRVSDSFLDFDIGAIAREDLFISTAATMLNAHVMPRVV